MHHVFIVNPTAGKGKALQMVEKIVARFKNFAHTFEIKITEAPGHAQILAKEAISTYDEVRLYSVGGDGTLNEVLNGMAGSQTELGIIPCGSGNDTVRSLYTITDPVKLIELLPLSPSVMIDLGKLNDKYFLNIASIGFDAEVVLKGQIFKRYPFISGSMSYILGVLTCLIRLKKYKLRFIMGDAPSFEKEVLLSIFANGSHYGGGMKAAPRAEINDGLLDFYLVDAMSRLRILKFFPVFQKGRHESLKEVTLARGTKLLIESQLPVPVNIDGEISKETRIAIDLLPGSLKVIIPTS